MTRSTQHDISQILYETVIESGRSASEETKAVGTQTHKYIHGRCIPLAQNEHYSPKFHLLTSLMD